MSDRSGQNKKEPTEERKLEEDGCLRSDSFSGSDRVPSPVLPNGSALFVALVP